MRESTGLMISSILRWQQISEIYHLLLKTRLRCSIYVNNRKIVGCDSRDQKMRNAQCQVTNRPITEPKACSGNARTHSKRQIQQLARSIEKFGFNNPV
jgi:hypothetical protein